MVKEQLEQIKLRTRIISALGSADSSGISTLDLLEEVGGSRYTTTKALEELEKDGKAKRRREGNSFYWTPCREKEGKFPKINSIFQLGEVAKSNQSIRLDFKPR